MRILSFKPGHDGTVALVEDGCLRFSIEAEKDSFPRYEVVTPSVVLEALSRVDDIPDVVCVSGWVRGFHSIDRPLEAGYFGWDESTIRTGTRRLLGRQVRCFSSTHERSHLMSAYGMSPFEQGRRCYALLWEGNIGSFYEMDAAAKVRRLGHVLEDPGNKYAFLFALADPATPAVKGSFNFEHAGKLMSLAAFSGRRPPSETERRVIDHLLSRRSIILSTSKADPLLAAFHNIGVESPAFKDLAGKFSDAIFDRFHAFAKEHLTERLPLLVSGGCGLNCDWNSKWRDSGLFPEVFVPPCTNDCGSAIGTAVDAQLHWTGNAKLSWNVAAGVEFVDDADPPEGYDVFGLDFDQVAEALERGAVVAWVQGRTELGPRALGHRSILAAPFDAAMRDRLNRLKQRDGYRPIAPVCLEEDVSEHLDWSGPSPYMLFFQRVTDRRLAAVTHVDGSARAQTVRRDQNEPLYELLRAFKRRTGCGVLCNTSLNFKGKGFINRMGDLLEFADDRGLDVLAVGNRFMVRRARAASA